MIGKNASRRPIAIIINPLIAPFIMSEKLLNAEIIMDPVMDFGEVVLRIMK